MAELSLPNLLVALRDCLCLQLEQTLEGPVCRCGIVHGAAPAWDACEGGAAWVRLVQTAPRTVGTNRRGVPPKCIPGDNVRVTATIELQVLRCALTPVDGVAPAADDLTVKALQLASDVDALYAVAACCDLDVVPVNYTPLGPEGKCVGGRLNVAVPTWICPTCVPESPGSPGGSPGSP